MGILEIEQEEKEKKEAEKAEHEKHVDEALKVYEKQKQAIKSIADTVGFKEVLRYWKDEKALCELRFAGKGGGTVDTNQMIRLKGRYEEACGFLTFIDNLLA